MKIRKKKNAGINWVINAMSVLQHVFSENFVRFEARKK